MPFGEGSKTIYARVSKGKLVYKKDGQKFETYCFEGHLKNIKIRSEEWEGQTYDKVCLNMVDDKDSVQIQFRLESWYAYGFFDRLKKINPDQALTVGVSQSDKNEKLSFCWLKQNGASIKSDKNYPKPETVNVSGKDLKNWTPFIEQAKKDLAEFMPETDLPF